MRLHLVEGKISQQREGLVWAPQLQVSKNGRLWKWSWKQKEGGKAAADSPRLLSFLLCAAAYWGTCTPSHTQMHKDIKTAQTRLQMIHFTAERSVKAIRLSALHRRLEEDLSVCRKHTSVSTPLF